MRELTELEKVLLRKVRRFQKEMAIMEDMIINGLQEGEKQSVKPKVEKYNPATDLQFFDDEDFMILWKEFISIRIRKKASNTDRAIKTIINKILKESKGNKKYALAMLDKSVNSGWSDVYPVKDYIVPISEKKATNTDRYNYRKQAEENPEEFTSFDPNNLMGLVKIKRV